MPSWPLRSSGPTTWPSTAGPPAAVPLLATLAWLSLLVAALVTRTWWLLALIPVIAYGLAWFSHFFLERNRPRTFKHPLFSLLADHKMAFYMVTGRLGREWARLNIHPKK